MWFYILLLWPSVCLAEDNYQENEQNEQYAESNQESLGYDQSANGNEENYNNVNNQPENNTISNEVSDFDADQDPLIKEVVGWDIGEYLFVMTHGVYIRQGPGLFYPTMKVLKQNQKVKVLEKKGNWVLVSHGGWVPDKNLDVRRYDKPKKYRNSLMTIVRLEKVKVYGGPGATYPVVSSRRKGDRVRIIKNYGPWAQIGPSQYVLRLEIDGREREKSLNH